MRSRSIFEISILARKPKSCVHCTLHVWPKKMGPFHQWAREAIPDLTTITLGLAMLPPIYLLSPFYHLYCTLTSAGTFPSIMHTDTITTGNNIRCICSHCRSTGAMVQVCYHWIQDKLMLQSNMHLLITSVSLLVRLHIRHRSRNPTWNKKWNVHRH